MGALRSGRVNVMLPSPSMLVALVGLAAAIGGQATLGKDQVTTRSVKDDSLRLAHFKASEHARMTGRPGAEGPPGRPGPSAIGKVITRTATFPAPNPRNLCSGPCDAWVPDHKTEAVSCDLGYVAISGGANSDDKYLDVRGSYPVADGTGWAAAVEGGDITRPHGFTVFVLCVQGQAMTFR